MPGPSTEAWLCKEPGGDPGGSVPAGGDVGGTETDMMVSLRAGRSDADGKRERMKMPVLTRLKML